MASRQSNVDYMIDQMADAGEISARKMFGEFGVYCGGKLVGLICDDQLFVKPTAAGRAFAGEITEASPYPGAKPCLLIPEDRIEDAQWLASLIVMTVAELPAPKKKGKM